MQSGQATLPRTSAVDVPNLVRGASTGFSILVIGGLMSPLTTLISDMVATVWVTGVAVLAFAVAARRSRLAAVPAAHGAAAAVFAYVLVLPLLLPFEQARNPEQIGMTFLAAVVVGSAAGSLAARRSWAPRRG